VKILVVITAVALLSVSTLLAQDMDDAAEPGLPAKASSSDLATDSDNSLLPTSPVEIAPPTTPEETESLDQRVYGEDQALTEAPPEPEAQSRPWKVNLHASDESYYDDNIFISPTGRQSDFINLLSLGAGLTVGDYTARENNYFTSDYTASGELFAKHTNQDAFEQNVSLEGQVKLAHFTFRADVQIQDTTEANIDIGSRVRSQTYTGHASARYDISEKTYIEATAQIIVSHYSSYIGSNDERGGIAFHYLPSPRVTVGIAAMGGVLNVAGAPSQTYEQILASFQMAATGKFTIDASAGVEDRQTSHNKGLITPVFDLTGAYKPFEGLDLTLAAFRRVVNSAFYAGADYIATGVSAGAEYQISSRFKLLLDAGFMNCDYRDVATGPGIARDDNYIFVRPALRYTASSYCDLELYYFYRDNGSTVNSFTFNDNQVGISVNFKF
jgi:hypothetical protein